MNDEVRSEWPGGIKTDQDGRQEWEADPLGMARDGYEAVRPVWVCPLCRKKLWHTEAEHLAFVYRGETPGSMRWE